MKYIKILYWIVNVVLLFQLIHYLGTIYLYYTGFMETLMTYYEEVLFRRYSVAITLGGSIITFFGLIYSSMGLRNVLNSGYFNLKSVKNFNRAAVYFMVAGLILLIFHSVLVIMGGFFENAYASFLEDFFIIIVGFTLLTISHLIKNGNLIKAENDLTI